MQILARDMIGEHSVNLDSIELPIGVLLQRAHPRVADALTSHQPPSPPECQVEIQDQPRRLSIKHSTEANLTLAHQDVLTSV